MRASSLTRGFTAFLIVTLLVVVSETLWLWFFGPAHRAWGLVDLSPRRTQAFFALSAGLCLTLLVLLRGFVVFRHPAVVGLACFALFMSNTRSMSTADSDCTIRLPFRLFAHHTPYFDGATFEHLGTRHYCLVDTADGHLASRYPVMSALATLPMTLPAVLLTPDSDAARLTDLDKISAASLTALELAILFMLLGALTSHGTAWFVVAAASIASPALVIWSQAMWQHTVATLGLTIALWALYDPTPRRWRDAWFGFGAALVVTARPNAIVALAPFAAVWAWSHRAQWRAWAQATLGATPPLLPSLIYQTYVFGHPLRSGYGAQSTEGWNTPLLEGLSGEWLSPGRGFLLFTPWLLWAFASRRTRWPGLVAVTAYSLLMAKWWAWHGAYAAGPRMLSDVFPWLFLALGLALHEDILAPRWSRRLFAGALTFSAATTLVLFLSAPTAIERSDVYGLDAGAWTWRAHPLVRLVLR